MLIKVRDGRGRRIVTEVKRPDPQAVLVINEDVPFEVSSEELQRLIDLRYVKLADVRAIDDKGKEREVVATLALGGFAPGPEPESEKDDAKAEKAAKEKEAPKAEAEKGKEAKKG